MTKDTRFTVHHLRVEDVYPDEDQPRSEITDIDALAASIADLGQIVPITVRKTGNTYRIIGGERRWTAVKQLGRPTIAAFVADTDDAEVALLELADNLHVPLTDLELSRGAQRAFTFDTPIERIAAATGETPERVERARAGYRAAADPVAASDMTFDRLIAIGEFADDPEAVKAIENADAKQWPQVVRELNRARSLAASIEAAETLVAESGIERIDRPDFAAMVSLGYGTTVPEGAQWVVVSAPHWQAKAEIQWYGPREAPITDPAEAEAARQEAERRAALKERAAERMAFIVANVDVGRGLKKLAQATWEEIEGERVPEGVVGFTARVMAAQLADIEDAARELLVTPKRWNLTSAGPDVDAYLKALKADGYEFTEEEVAAIKAFRAALKEATSE